MILQRSDQNAAIELPSWQMHEAVVIRSSSGTVLAVMDAPVGGWTRLALERFTLSFASLADVGAEVYLGDSKIASKESKSSAVAR